MKKLLTILFVLISFAGFSQTVYPTPYTQQGSPSTLVQVRGGWKADSTAILPTYTDTIAANTSKTKLYAGAIIRVGNDYYFRSSDASRWILFSSGGSSNCPPNGIISPPGSVTWSGVGLVFDALAIDYNINCNHYHSPATTLTLSAADPTYPRIDLIIVDTNNVCSVLEGTASAAPVAPTVDPLSELQVTLIYVPAGSTTPGGQSITMIYNENVEWTGSSDISVIDFAATSPSPCFGTVSTVATNATDGQYVQWTNGSSLVLSDYPYTKLSIKNGSAPTDASRTRFLISYYLGSTQVSTTFSVQNGTFGYNASDVGTCQLIVLPNYLLTYAPNQTFDRIKIVVTGIPSTTEIDRVYLLSGAVTPPTTGNSWLLSGNSGTNPSLDFIGTTDSTDWAWRTNNQIRGIVPANGFQQNGDTTLRQIKWDETTKTFYWDYTPTIRALSPLSIVDSSNGFKYIECLGCGGGSGGWLLTGNSGTTAGTNFWGTTDNVDLVLKRNSSLAGRIGTSNTSFGVGSNGSSPSGANNTGIGANANGSVTTGAGNTAIGGGALYSSTGSNNTGIGKDVGFNLQSGDNNILVGANIMTSTPANASNNTVIGYNAMQNSTTGSLNAVIGGAAFNSNTTGSRNTGVGYGISGATATTNNAIALGYNATAPSSTLSISDSTIHMYFNLDSASGTAPNMIGIDASGNWHRYEVAGGSLTGVPYGVFFADGDGNVTNNDGFYYNAGAEIFNISFSGSDNIVTSDGVNFYIDNASTHDRRVGINNASPDPSAALDITSTTAGILIPRMTETDRDAISSPATGLMIFQTDGTSGFYYYDGASWTGFGGGGSSLFPTTGTETATGDVTGDLDGNDLSILNGNVGIGTTTPDSTLTVNGSANISGNVKIDGTVKARNVIGNTVLASDADFNANAGTAYILPDNTAIRTITLPASPADGDLIKIYLPLNESNNWITNVSFTKPDGSTGSQIDSLSTTTLQYDAANSVWRAVINY